MSKVFPNGTELMVANYDAKTLVPCMVVGSYEHKGKTWLLLVDKDRKEYRRPEAAFIKTDKKIEIKSP